MVTLFKADSSWIPSTYVFPQDSPKFFYAFLSAYSEIIGVQDGL